MKIICIGRNYVDHINEFKNDKPKEPLFFLKPETALIRNNHPFFYPDFSNRIDYETEIVIKICKLGKNIQTKFAHRYYNEIAIGIDFTARDIQQNAIKNGLPWEIAKAFDGSAPISKFINISEFKDVKDINFSLSLNNEIVQKANTKEMLFSFDDIIAHVSKFLTLKIGDLIFTGTPSGVGPVKINDRLQASIEDDIMLNFIVK
ncbi:MAG: 2-hydroxyhepta-2,4-diene-1,7-dioate isomerase [Bacteroidetes bacterium]|nr:MAG: 2-hydroxyhepta-2,4-diene-1,7-dioate isomerase [Bacteroidota bacterium]